MSHDDSSNDNYIPSPASEATPTSHSYARNKAVSTAADISLGNRRLSRRAVAFSVKQSRSDCSRQLASFQQSKAVKLREDMHIPLGICPCTSFGMDREEQFPHFFFCHECSLWDSKASTGNLSQKISTSHKYRCRAKHQVGSLFPTQPQTLHHTLCGSLSTEFDAEEEEVNDEVDDKTSEQESEEDNIAEDEFVVCKDDVLTTRLFDESEEYYTDKKPAATKRKFSEMTTQICDGQHASSYLSSAWSSTILPSTLVNTETTNNTATVGNNNSNEVIIHNLQFALFANLARIQELEGEVAKLKKTIARLKPEKAILCGNVASYNYFIPEDSQRVDGQPSKKQISAKDCIDATRNCVSTLRSYQAEGRNSIFIEQTCLQITSIIWDEDLFCGRLVNSLVSRAKTWLSNNDFAPHKILEAMDSRGGVLNYEGVEVL